MTVYKITNNMNDKVYIGRTKKTLKRRFTNHKASCRFYSGTEHKLYLAMKEIGIEIFKIEAIEECETREELGEKEKKWIKKLNSKKAGYNTLSGGGITNDPSQDTKDKLSKRALERYETEEGGRLREAMSKFQKERCKMGENPIAKKGAEHPFSKDILKLDKKTMEIISEFNGSYEAERETRINQSDIIKVCKNKKASAGGFSWAYKDLFSNSERNIKREVMRKSKIKPNSKKVVHTDLKTGVKKEFLTKAAVGKFLNISPQAITSKLKKISLLSAPNTH